MYITKIRFQAYLPGRTKKLCAIPNLINWRTFYLYLLVLELVPDMILKSDEKKAFWKTLNGIDKELACLIASDYFLLHILVSFVDTLYNEFSNFHQGRGSAPRLLCSRRIMSAWTTLTAELFNARIISLYQIALTLRNSWCEYRIYSGPSQLDDTHKWFSSRINLYAPIYNSCDITKWTHLVARNKRLHIMLNHELSLHFIKQICLMMQLCS